MDSTKRSSNCAYGIYEPNLRTEQNPQRSGRVRLGHQVLANQKRVKSRRAKASQVFMRAQTGFADSDAFFGNALDQLVRCFDAHFQGAKIAIVYTQNARASGQCPRQL